MRRYAYLKEPIKTNKKDYIYKIMLYQTKKRWSISVYVLPKGCRSMFI